MTRREQKRKQKIKEQEILKKMSAGSDSNAKAVVKICLAIIKRINEEIDAKQWEEWSLELIEEKMEIVAKNEEKPFEAIIGLMENMDISPTIKEQALDDALQVQAAAAELKAKLRKRKDELQLEKVEQLKKAYNMQMLREEEEKEQQRKLLEAKEEEEKNLLNALCEKCNKMNGAFDRWLNFKEKFEEIHNDDNVSSLLKLKVLKTVCSGDAANIVNAFEETDENYSKAYDKLKDKYDNAYMQVVIAISKIKEKKQISKQSLPQIMNTLDQSVKTSIHFAGAQVEGFVSAFILNMIHPNLYTAWQMFWTKQAMNEKELPKWAILKTFLQGECDSQANTSSQANTTTQSSTVSQANAATQSNALSQGNTVTQASALVPSTDTSVQRTSTWQQRANFQRKAQQSQCKLCGVYHLPYQCGLYLNMKLSKKLKYQQENDFCKRCLNPNHEGKCKDPKCEMECMRCRIRFNQAIFHNSTLCPVKNEEYGLARDSEEEWAD